MRSQTWRIVGLVLSGAIFVIAFVIPAVVLMARLLREGVAPTDGFTISVRQWRLLADSLMLALGGAGVSLLLALPGAFVWGSARRGLVPGGVTLCLLLGCLISPMVHCFGWQQMFGLAGAGGRWAPAACAVVWGSWIWPVPAFIIGSGWRREGREAYEAALLLCSPGRAFLRIAVPLLARYVLLSMLIVFVLLCGEYAVPHAWGLRVYATELLSWSTATTRTIDAVWPVLPLLGCMAVVGAAAVLVARRFQSGAPGSARIEPRAISTGPTVLCLLVFTATVALPIGGLVWRLGSLDVIRQAWDVHGGDLVRSVGLMAAAGCAALVMAVGLLFAPALWRFALITAIVFGVLPGALVGEAVYGTFVMAEEFMPGALGGAGPWYDHWIMVVLGMTAKYAWIGFFIIGAAMMSRQREIEEQASTDGAAWGEIVRHIRLARHYPAVLCALFVTIGFALADVAAATQVQVSSVRLVSLLLVEAMHRFEDELLISISLWLVIAALPGGLAAVWTIRRSE